MITRHSMLLLLGLFSLGVHSQYVPESSAGDDNDCALYLTGPGRSSAFDYNLNLLRGSFGYDGQHTCITYDAVNAAYIDARKRINVATPKGDWKTEDIASVGELMLDISISLARTYGLTYEDIEKGLPLIDTSKTLIREVCPPFLAHVECRAGKYRRFDGLCTNLQHPTWGAAMTPFQRLIAPLYADGINAPRISVTGRDLPLSRIVSRTMHPDEGFHDHAGTVMVIAWGQFMDHDYTLTGTPLDPFNRNDPEECCNRPPHQKHPYCNELRIPDDDYFYRLFNIKCIDFVRGFPSPRAGCRLGSRQQFNTLTGVLDGNTVYGVSEKFSRKLRSGVGGLLRMNPVFEEYGLKDLLPLKLDIPDEGCTRPNRSMYCFEAGEIRVNEQLVLTCMHTLLAREHNRCARGLAEVNPHWDDETLFQESRRIVVATIQHITYNEFLPILLGKDVMDKFGLLLNKEGYWDGYDSNINPSVIDAFAAAAFRFGHSLLPTAVERWSKAHKFIASKRLSDLIRRPYDLYRAGVFDEYLMGLMNQVAQAMDDSITQEVTNHLFKKPGARFGMDLVSFNMQRGREFGLPGYMEFRKFCGLPGAASFQELFGSMPNETIQRYESIFEHPSDVDLWSGGVSERPLPGSMLGPTFACIIATQFSYSRRGDRFWYELPNQPSSFSPEQLVELRKARLSRLICDNTDIIDTVQVYPMVLPDHEINPRVPCRSGILPSIDFSKWADFGGVPHNPYNLETKAEVQNVTNPANTTLESSETAVKGKTTSTEVKENLQSNTTVGEIVNKNVEKNLTNVTDVKLENNKIMHHEKVNATLKTEKSKSQPRNALRRRRDAPQPKKTSPEVSSTTASPAGGRKQRLSLSSTTEDSATAAIIVTEITGHLSDDDRSMLTTEESLASALGDRRDHRTPQTFTGSTEGQREEQPPPPFRFDLSAYYPDEGDYNYYEQVSDNPSARLRLTREDYTDNKFIAEDGNQTAAQSSTGKPSADEFYEYVVAKNFGNKKRPLHKFLEREENGRQFLSSEESRDDSSERDGCSDEGSSGAGGRSAGSHERLVAGPCSGGRTSLEGGGVSIDHPLLYDEIIPTTEHLNRNKYKQAGDGGVNLKEQFEHIPLDYKHDAIEDKKSASLKDKEGYATVPPIDLDVDLEDTTVEIDNITLPGDIFDMHDSKFIEKLRQRHYGSEEEDDHSGKLQDDRPSTERFPRYYDDHSGEEDTDKPSTIRYTESSENPFYDSKEYDEQEFIPLSVREKLRAAEAGELDEQEKEKPAAAKQQEQIQPSDKPITEKPVTRGVRFEELQEEKRPKPENLPKFERPKPFVSRFSKLHIGEKDIHGDGKESIANRPDPIKLRFGDMTANAEDENPDQGHLEDTSKETPEYHEARYQQLRRRDEDDESSSGPPDIGRFSRLKKTQGDSPHRAEDIRDPNLKYTVSKIVEKTKKTEDESGDKENPKYNYFWTLEYGQPT